MPFLSRKPIAFFVLVAFLTGLAMYSLNPAWLKHELDHDQISLAATADHGDTLVAGDKSIDSSGPFSDAEHKLLHLLSHSTQAPSVWHLVFGKQHESPVFPPVSLVFVPPAIEPLFRPPRHLFFA